MWNKYDGIRFRSPGHGFDFRDATLVGDPTSFFEPELYRVGTVRNYNSDEIMACGQQDCIDPHAILIPKNQEHFGPSRNRR
jgi:hypothetical protein